MPGAELTATVKPRGNGSEVTLSGTVDKAAKEPIEEAYRQAAEHPGEIVLDFTEVDYINSTGIAVIVGVLAMARADGKKVGGVGLTEHYREVFRITRLSDFMHIYEDVAAES